jgi:ATP-dependent DNA ligase
MDAAPPTTPTPIPTPAPPSTATRPAPIEPMLAAPTDALPPEGDFLFEPKWDGFRALVFRAAGAEIAIQSRDGHPFDRYFPDLHAALARLLPPSCVVDGEIVIATPRGLDFDALQLRIHPAASRVERLARETPASFVAFDLLALDGASLMDASQAERRAALETMLADARPPLYLTPATRDRALAVEWLQRFEGAGLDGVVAKPLDGRYRPGKRAMLKIKHARSADCVVAGFRWHKSSREGGPPAVGSLLLGLHDAAGVLHHVGITSSFTMQVRRALVDELAPLREDALAGHPWRGWAAPERTAAGAAAGGAAPAASIDGQRMPGAQSRWSGAKDLSWEPLRPERVCEVRYDHLQGDRFRHATTFLRWRVDKAPADCDYAQLEVVPPYELKRIFER